MKYIWEREGCNKYRDFKVMKQRLLHINSNFNKILNSNKNHYLQKLRILAPFFKVETIPNKLSPLVLYFSSLSTKTFKASFYPFRLVHTVGSWIKFKLEYSNGVRIGRKYEFIKEDHHRKYERNGSNPRIHVKMSKSNCFLRITKPVLTKSKFLTI